MSRIITIGMYDSGVGGLSVLKELRRVLPGVRVLYYGDTAHVPYGGRRKEEILAFSRQIISFLQGQGADLLLVACNTSSALALATVEQEFSLPLVGMIKPTLGRALVATRRKVIGVFATEATVQSGLYAEMLKARDPNVEVVSVACPKLVPLVEKGIFSGPEVEAALAEYLAPVQAAGADTLILGCTHYPFLTAAIQAQAEGITLVDPAVGAVAEVRRLLMAHGLLPAEGREEGENGEADLFFTSGHPRVFRELAGRLLTVPAGDLLIYYTPLGGSDREDG